MRRGLLLLTVITFVTWVGTRMTTVALPLVALEETGQAWTTGLVGGMAGLPLLTVGWWGKGLRDRLTGGRALAVVMGVNAAGLAIVPVASLTGQVGAVALCVSGLVTGVAGALLGPAERSLVSDLADEHVARGGSTGPAKWLAWQDLAHRVSMIFAPPAGAWAVTVLGAGSLLWCQTAVVALAAIAFLGVPAGGTTHHEDLGGAQGEVTPGRPVSALAVLRSHPQVAAGVLMAGVGGVCWFGFSLGLAVLGVEYGMPGALIAAGMSGYGAASVAASLLVPMVIDRLPRMTAMLSSWIVLGAVFVALPLVVPSLAGIAVVAAVGGAAMPWCLAALNALISEQTHGPERRAAFTAQTVLHSGGASLGLLVGGALIGWAGSEAVLLATGLLQIAAAIGGAVWAWKTRPLGVSAAIAWWLADSRRP
ncbi:MFS transporter [Salinispora tropica]|uniref:Major facilitator superfamily MFS_1 n=1 Tax=Salinispora tropica (strain ATCC BAA-916 / DSM 44818 / JCM 13857 / NBRC 105044 / CNB-440) TaxID=369723 RepID=A4X5P3_SALTO|nr:MFS transporter [Salinispora tropica]ABP54193.1 major facilitator superfamily MFS_1 [Salinispora tropica CNB-440]